MPRPRVIGLLLALVTLLAYLPATHNGFINYDDDDYVTQNPFVQRGLTWAGVKWAFTTCHASNWHPVTWLSHMADCELFRLNPAGHHWDNILFHVANTLLVLVLFWSLTRALWPSAFVAALFAWHPLHVESAAWVAERKDVLSTFFALLTLWMYVRAVPFRRPGRGETETGPGRDLSPGALFASPFYWWALFFLALALMSKPMPVTLPFVMLLLDYWPLGRFTAASDAGRSVATLLSLAAEKIPFFLLSVASSVITFLAQSNAAVVPLASVPLPFRLENAITAYAVYLWKTIYPAHLAVYYPLTPIPSWYWTTIAAGLAAVTVAVCCKAKHHPFLPVGWFWFLGTLVPVIGLVQVGSQSMADRYTYFPLIGIFAIAAFGADELVRRFASWKIPLAAAGIVILLACLSLTEMQLRFWHDSKSIFIHSLRVTPDNALPHLNLGSAYEEENNPNAAMAEFQKVLQFNPGQPEAYNNIAKLLNDNGKSEEALEYCQKAVKLNPKFPVSHNNLGLTLFKLGHLDEALREFSQAAQLEPDYAEPRFQIGRTLLTEGRDAEAIPHFRQALQIEPDSFQMLIYAARVLAADENTGVRDGAEALALARRAFTLAGPRNPVALDTVAMAYAENGRFAEAVQIEQQAIALADSAGSSDDAAAMREHLAVYQKHQPWRQSFRKD